MQKLINKTALGLTLLAVAACSGGNVRESIGLKKNAPDEFRVLSNAPLAMPPEFTLRPPMPGAKRPQETNLEQQARDVLFNSSAQSNAAGVSKSESIFLSRADAQSANSEIKHLLEQEEVAATTVEKKKGFFDKVASFANIKGDKADPVVSSAKEKDRIAENKKEGKPANEGEVESVQPSSGGLLNKVFGY